MPTEKKAYVNPAPGAQGLNNFDSPRSIKDFQATVLTSMIPTMQGSKSMYGFEVFAEDTTLTGGINFLHGFRANKFTPAYLTGGTSATTVIGTWSAVADGTFRITIDGTVTNVTGLDFSAVTTMAEVATVIQTGLRTATSSTETVVWSTNHFIISSVNTTKISAITVTSAQGTGTDISGAGGTAFMDAETGRGTVTDKVLNGQFNQILFSQDDDYYYLTPSSVSTDTWGTIGDMGTASSKIHAYTLDDKAIFGTGTVGNTASKWDGLSFSSVTSPASSTADLLFYEFFQGQDFAALFGAGNPEAPSRLYYSDANDPDVWSGGVSGYIDIAKDDGYKITGLRVQGDQLIVFKNKNRYYVSTFYESDSGSYGVRVEPYKDNAGGAISHDTIEVLLNGDVVALAHKGIGLQGLGKSQAADGSLLPEDYSRDIMPLFDNINWSSADKAKGIFFDRKYWLAVPYGPGVTENNYVFIYHLDQKGWSVIPNISIGSWLIWDDENGNDVLYAGDSVQAKIYKWDKNTYTFNGELIQNRFRTGKLNLGSILDFEDLEVIALEGTKQLGDELTFKFIVDGVESEYTIDDTFNITTGGGGTYIGGAYIADEYIVGNSKEEENRWIAFLLVNDIQRKAREIEIQIENENLGANISINYISINEFTFNMVSQWPENYIIANPK